ncbi:DUF4233 domain-containing protein, partial [Microbacterium sp.]|uniref:DUF4233 domain-containing protein n=1 Tax=Microbacterium sp. TaxID=51671 RepID=UPI003C75BD67
RRARRARGAQESLAQIVLGFESVIVFLGGLAAYGLAALPEAIPQWWGIVVGAAAAVLMIATTAVVRYRWGIALGWAWQVIVVLGGFVVPAIAIVGLLFGAIYAYATIKGGALDRRNAQRTPPNEMTPPHATNGD